MIGEVFDEETTRRPPAVIDTYKRRLIGTVSVEKFEVLASMRKETSIPHAVLEGSLLDKVN